MPRLLCIIEVNSQFLLFLRSPKQDYKFRYKAIIRSLFVVKGCKSVSITSSLAYALNDTILLDKLHGARLRTVSYFLGM